MMQKRIAAGVFGLMILAICASAIHIYAAQSTHSREVRWLMAHTPLALYADATGHFADSLVEKSDGTLTARIQMPEDVGLVGEGDVPYATSMELLRKHETELSSVYAVAAGADANTLWTLSVPYLFENYEVLPPILDGEIGKRLLAAYSDATDAHALAFTLSGGFRVIASRVPVRTLADLRGLRIGTSGGPVAEATLRAVGAIPVPMDLESGVVSPSPSSIDAIETTYTRLSSVLAADSPYLSHVVDTEHSLFLTMIIASDSFYTSLSEAQRTALENAAMQAASLERDASRVLADSTKESLRQEGRLVELSSRDREDIRAMTDVAHQFSFIDASILEEIRQ